MKAFKMVSISGAVTAVLALGATAGLVMPITANAAELAINGAVCGSYQKATFNSVGVLSLDGVTGCEFDGGETPVNPNPGPDPVDPKPVDPNPVEPGEPGDNAIPSYCANRNADINYTINGYTGAPRQAANLKGTDDYIVKMIPGEGLGFGMADSYTAAGMHNTRTLAISECPGDFTEHLPKQGTCIAQGEQFISLKWSYDSATPRGQTQCRLDEGKTYYFNVRNATISGLDKTSCVSGTCNSYFVTTAAPL